MKRSPRTFASGMTPSSIACAMALAITACAGTGGTASADADKPKSPLRRLNPAPAQTYEIRLQLANVPGPFESVHATAQYDVENGGACGKINTFAGAIPRITSNEPFELTKVSEGEYTGTIYLDRIIDEAYYDREVCSWVLTEARVALVANANVTSTRYVSGLDAKLIQQQSAQTRYFWSGYYPRATMDAFRDFGKADLADVPADKAAEFFTITLSAKEIKT